MNRDIEYESIAKEAGLDAIDMEAGRDTREVPVEMILKGLWRVDGEVVVEGECPVSVLLNLHELAISEDGLMVGMPKRITWRIWTAGKEDRRRDAYHSSYRGRVTPLPSSVYQ